MRNDIFTLPYVQIVAGQSQTYRWRLWKSKTTPYNAEGCVGNFALLDYSNQEGEPLLSKPLTFEIGDDAHSRSVARVNLDSLDTVEFHGRYIYQITIMDVDGAVEIPGQGILYIAHNINESFLKQ